MLKGAQNYQSCLKFAKPKEAHKSGEGMQSRVFLISLAFG